MCSDKSVGFGGSTLGCDCFADLGAIGLMGDLIHQCDILEINSQNPNSSFAVFQDQLATSPLADLYQILRQRILGSEIEYLGAKEDLEGVLNKLELGHLKAEMTEITEKMTQGTANTQDLERYREISQRLSRQ